MLTQIILTLILVYLLLHSFAYLSLEVEQIALVGKQHAESLKALNLVKLLKYSLPVLIFYHNIARNIVGKLARLGLLHNAGDDINGHLRRNLDIVGKELFGVTDERS